MRIGGPCVRTRIEKFAVNTGSEATRAIAPVSDASPRPFWSVMIPTHDCGPRLEETLQSVRDQDPGPEQMQIAIVDDASSGETVRQIAQRVFGARAEHHCQPAPVDIATNWNRCIELSRGHWIHLLHQDDLVLPGFYERLARADELQPEVGAAFCRNWLVDDRGARTGISAIERDVAGVCEAWLEQIAVSNRIKCPSIVVRRRSYEQLGGFRSDLSFTLDWEMWIRIASQYPIYYEPEALAAFRVHGNSETARLCNDGSNVVDLLRTIEITNEYLPATRRGELRKKARRYCVSHAINRAQEMLNRGDRAAAHTQLRSAIRLNPSLRLSAQIWKIYSRSMLSWLCNRGVRQRV
jgi:glycosyltransferase involved in cell wall biosynthesis